MMCHIKTNLLPDGIKELMRTIKKVSIYAVTGVVVLIAVIEAFGLIHDLMTKSVAYSAMLIITIPLMIPGFRYSKVSQSVACFTDDEIQILNQNGKCWRTINYKAITSVRVEEISGFFYGNNKIMFRNPYICIFMDESTCLPSVSFEKLFISEDFIIIGYQQSTFLWLKQKIKTGDGTLS